MLAICLALVVAVSCASWWLLPSWIAHAISDAPNARVDFDPARNPDPRDYQRWGVDEQFRVSVGTPDDAPASLSVWLMRPRTASQGMLLLLHGIRSDKSALAGLGNRLASRGFCVVLPDLRGHGRSSGDWLTYGVREARDLSRLVDVVQTSGRCEGRVGALGFSYGAAVAIQLAAIDVRVRSVVAIAPFSSLDAVVPDYVRAYLGWAGALIPRQVIAAGVGRAGKLGDFNPDAASPIAAIRHTEAKVLLIHGRKDGHVPFQHSVALHSAAGENSELLLLEGEDHYSISSDRHGIIAGRGVDWLRGTPERP